MAHAPSDKLLKLNLMGIIMSYKLQTYEPYGKRDMNGILINNKSIKHNYDFIKFAYKYWIFPLYQNQKKIPKRDKYIYIGRVKSLSMLVELTVDLLEQYFKLINMD